MVNHTLSAAVAVQHAIEAVFIRLYYNTNPGEGLFRPYRYKCSGKPGRTETEYEICFLFMIMSIYLYDMDKYKILYRCC